MRRPLDPDNADDGHHKMTSLIEFLALTLHGTNKRAHRNHTERDKSTSPPYWHMQFECSQSISDKFTDPPSYSHHLEQKVAERYLYNGEMRQIFVKGLNILEEVRFWTINAHAPNRIKVRMEK